MIGSYTNSFNSSIFFPDSLVYELLIYYNFFLQICGEHIPSDFKRCTIGGCSRSYVTIFVYSNHSNSVMVINIDETASLTITGFTRKYDTVCFFSLLIVYSKVLRGYGFQTSERWKLGWKGNKDGNRFIFCSQGNCGENHILHAFNFLVQ